MTIHNMLKETYVDGKRASTGQVSAQLGSVVNTTTKNKIQNLEDKVEEQSEKLDKITSMLNAISEKTSTS
jgi:hypothetical protein